MDNDNVIFNFSDVYREETFYLHEGFRWIDCADIKGADCFCDGEASREIQRRMRDLSPHGLHFIDSGNYHYLSKFFTDKIGEDFILVVFDHHPDMQSSLFDGLLTCGDWVKAVLDGNPHVRKVVLVGTSDKLLDEVDGNYSDKLIEYRESQLHDRDAWRRFYDMQFTLPIYVSVDKDVMSEDVEDTNWDQGKATLADLKHALSILLHHDRIIGIDICGECPYSIQGLLDPNLRKDNEVNRQLSALYGQQIANRSTK